MNILKKILFNQHGYIGKNQKAQWAAEAGGVAGAAIGNLADKDGDGTGRPVKLSNPFTGTKEPQTAADDLNGDGQLNDIGNVSPISGGIVGNTGITGGHFDIANKFVHEQLLGLAPIGTASLLLPRIGEENRGRMDRFANGSEVKPEDELPIGPGNSYLSHLFKHYKMGDKIKKQKEHMKGIGKGAAKIFTDQEEALKSALKLIGCYSEKNPGGLPIDIHEAKNFWFGDDEVDEVQEAEWRASVETGDAVIDPKRVRRFTNHDGSLTFEVLNPDKTVMSRFTCGNYDGTQIFAQGGYKKFAEVLAKAKKKVGPNHGGKFDAMRRMF